MSEENNINDMKKDEIEIPNEVKPKKKKDISKTAKSKQTKGEDKDLYFIIYYQRKQKENPEDLIFSEDCDSIPQVILTKEVKTSTNEYAYKKVYKYKKECGKKNVELIFFFQQEDNKYFINFKVKEETFIYDVELKKGHKFLDDKPKVNIDQKIMEYQDKLDLFLEALKQNNEENKNEGLFKETIDLYSKKGNFSLLISLFSKIYQERRLCESLLEKFYYMNIKVSKDKKENNLNSDRDKKLGDQFNSLMVKIATESESLIKENWYNPIHFYGLLFCYLNYYDYITLENCVNKFNRENPVLLYEIFLTYFSQFFKPVKIDEIDNKFFIKFFDYIFENKEFSNFIIGLRYIYDIDTFIEAIDEIKEKIFYKYIKRGNDKTPFKPIEIKDSLQFKKENIKKIIKGIESINNYSKEIKCLLVYFKSDFWKSLLRNFNKPEPECFSICLKLRECFIKYSNIIAYICDKEKDKVIIKDITDFRNIDELAYILNENMKRFFKEKKGELNNAEILGYIMSYNPYYREPKYKFKREVNILDYLDFKYDIYSTDEDVIREHFSFIHIFHQLDYEDIFKDNMIKFIDKMVNKITDISSFDTVINLIRVEKIEEKIKDYLEKLKMKYELIVKPEIEKLSDDKLKKSAEIVARFEILLFLQENNIDFLKDDISKLKICPLIYKQLIKICKGEKYNPIKTFIFDQLLNNIKDIDDIITFFDCLEKEDKENFLKDLMKKCRFTKNEFYSTEENNKINLLCSFYEKKKIDKIHVDIESTLDEIINDINRGEINKKKLEEFLGNTEEVAKRRLDLINLVFLHFNPESAYNKLNGALKQIKNDIEVLSHIKRSFSNYQKEMNLNKYEDKINLINDYINKLENIKIKDYQKIFDSIRELKNLEEKANQIDSKLSKK